MTSTVQPAGTVATEPTRHAGAAPQGRDRRGSAGAHWSVKLVADHHLLLLDRPGVRHARHLVPDRDRREQHRLVDGAQPAPTGAASPLATTTTRSSTRSSARPSSTASPSRCRRPSSRSSIAAFAAYAFTFMEFPGRDVLFLVIVSLLVVPNFVALVPLLQLYGDLGHQRHVPGGVAGPHRLRHVAGDLPPAQLHGHAAAGRSSSRPRSTAPATTRPSTGSSCRCRSPRSRRSRSSSSSGCGTTCSSRWCSSAPVRTRR